MADLNEESREVGYIFTEKESEVFKSLLSFGLDEPVAYDCIASRNPTEITTISDFLENYAPRLSVGSLKLDVDVSEALTGLKAVTREAREATKAVKALETESGRITVEEDANKYRDVRAHDLYLGTTNGSVYLSTDKNAAKRLPTDVLVEELASREDGGVKDTIRSFEDLADLISYHLPVTEVDSLALVNAIPEGKSEIMLESAEKWDE